MSRKRLQLTDHPIGCRKQNPGLVQPMERPLGGFRRSVRPRSARSLTGLAAEDESGVRSGLAYF